MSEQPWYHNGLRFKCTGCGDCCSGAPGYVWVNREEIEALARRLALDVADFEAQYVRSVGIRKSLVEYNNGDCVFLDPQSRKCQVYHERPRQCRTWPFWDSNVRTPEAWK
ncbi:MAG: YkgJ family cysteine cluster protein, partial [Planctomycetaceae bacterium]|nr:YkgJ family cysteine cluster protein [Planctomycetaceae bacterium]